MWNFDVNYDITFRQKPKRNESFNIRDSHSSDSPTSYLSSWRTHTAFRHSRVASNNDQRVNISSEWNGLSQSEFTEVSCFLFSWSYWLVLFLKIVVLSLIEASDKFIKNLYFGISCERCNKLSLPRGTKSHTPRNQSFVAMLKLLNIARSQQLQLLNQGAIWKAIHTSSWMRQQDKDQQPESTKTRLYYGEKIQKILQFHNFSWLLSRLINAEYQKCESLLPLNELCWCYRSTDNVRASNKIGIQYAGGFRCMYVRWILHIRYTISPARRYKEICNWASLRSSHQGIHRYNNWIFPSQAIGDVQGGRRHCARDPGNVHLFHRQPKELEEKDCFVCWSKTLSRSVPLC